ncbi:dynamin family protein [Pseudalkalibacillus sp. Hm43]|uniref:dynamin family protein n=1 Tax=Pseudalkalibacillus sp. Hm43 TaxID=3450742 RepID=UPI003F44244A
MTTNRQNKTNIWLDRFYQMDQHFAQNQADQAFLHKIRQLAQKADAEEITIAFCGHFSAGKSSMINTLMGDDMLPSSPIPTSANIVALREGEPRVILTDQHGKKIAYEGEMDLDEVKKASKDGEGIRTIEILKHHPFLNDDTVLMDTPGIDSTDDAHRISTESMLHLADVIFYVMDYNHVQSELNFEFTKEMQDLGKEVYLVVNQIDKHSEKELSFADFKRQTTEAFMHWGVRPKETFFTSLKATDHTENQLDRLQQELKQIKANKQAYIRKTLESMSAQIINEYLEKKYPDVDEGNQKDSKSLIHEIESFEDQKAALEEQDQKVEKEFHAELRKLIDNARVAPYEVRELGRAVLESLKEDFKTGLFFTRKKTEEERESRIKRFVEAVNEKAKTELEWHLKDELQKQMKKLNVHDADIENSILEMEHKFEPEDIWRLQQKGATFNEAYVLQYNRDVEDDLKKRYRKDVVQLFEKIKEMYLNEQVKPQQMKLNDELQQLKVELEKVKGASVENDLYMHEQETLRQLLHSNEEANGTEEWFKDVLDHLQSEVEEGKWIKQPDKHEADAADFTVEEEEIVEGSTVNIEQAASQLDQASELLSDWSSLSDLTKRMKERSGKIKNKEYTVALFGAFSAGKSSFANAWMKQDVLPVSPNPTTATINKILPVTDENKHGTVKIQLKSVEIILEEVNHSLQRFGKECRTLEEAVEVIQTLDSEKPGPHYNFLMAVSKGYAAMKDYLGSEQIIDHENFGSFVAQEERACFTESVELYYDCELTREGITLVDTPGADSINARHTSVAFEYIKNADAIVFVTYYNHAFSKADRDFLIQLGRVKDTFSMDKMYFVINAADLAKDEEEREAVVDYVRSQLNTYGIRHPRMYALSSKEALNERKGESKEDHSKFGSFAESFHTNTIRERDDILQQQANQLLQAAKDRLTEWIQNAQADKETQAAQKDQLKTDQTEIEEKIHSSSTKPYEKAVVQETNELLHYVVHRLMLTFNDEFKIAFNPSVLSQKNVGKEQLLRCLEELLESMAFQLSQELRATTLRVEKKLNDQRLQFFDMIADFTSAKSQYEYMEMAELSIETPEVEAVWSKSTRENLRPSLKRFKNPKQFFEGNGRDELREELSEKFLPELQMVVDRFTEQFNLFYKEKMTDELNRLKEQMIDEIQQYYIGLIESFGSKEQLETLQTMKHELDQIIQQEVRVNHE